MLVWMPQNTPPQLVCAHPLTSCPVYTPPLLPGQAPSAAPQPHKPINTGVAAVEELIGAVSNDAKLAEAFVRTRWPLLERLEQHRLVPLLLDLVRVLPGEERWACRDFKCKVPPVACKGKPHLISRRFRKIG